MNILHSCERGRALRKQAALLAAFYMVFDSHGAAMLATRLRNAVCPLRRGPAHRMYCMVRDAGAVFCRGQKKTAQAGRSCVRFCRKVAGRRDAGLLFWQFWQFWQFFHWNGKGRSDTFKVIYCIRTTSSICGRLTAKSTIQGRTWRPSPPTRIID